MGTYSISNRVSGLNLGTYTADTREGALDAMARDAGYESHADALATTGEDASELEVTEIASAASFAAVGDDGRRPVVWGVGDTANAALVDAHSTFRETGVASELRIVEISAERRAKIEGGEVGAADL
jgi:hypothetical protein